MKKYLLFFILISLLSNPLFASVKFVIRYSRPLQIIDILDNVARSSEGEMYREWEFYRYWINEFGFNENDKLKFRKYQEIRNKYIEKLPEDFNRIDKNQHGLFTNPIINSRDSVFLIFVQSSTMDDVWQQIETLVDRNDLDFLKSFYKEYEQSLLQIIDQFEIYNKQYIKSFSDKIDNYENLNEFISKVQTFFKVEDSLEYNVFIQWWPKVRKGNVGSAEVKGSVLILRVNDKNRMTLDDYVSVLFHEMVHAIDMTQPIEQKRYLTDCFIKRFENDEDLIKKIRPNSIYEPMAVTLGQMCFIEWDQNQKLKLNRENWYANRWINEFSKTFYPLVSEYFKTNKAIDEQFMQQTAMILYKYVTRNMKNKSKKG